VAALPAYRVFPASHNDDAIAFDRNCLARGLICRSEYFCIRKDDVSRLGHSFLLGSGFHRIYIN
jgi:hypothetical protein